MAKKFKVLLVEDDEYKIEGIRSELPSGCEAKVARSVSSAVRAVVEDTFDVIFLDMALPTFEKGHGSSSGSSQPQGGVEVLRSLKYHEKKSKVIVVSQYAGIEIDGEFIKLEESPELLSERYSIEILGAIEYDFENHAWRESFRKVLARI